MKLQNLSRWFMISLVLVMAIGCEYDGYPDPVWNPDATGGIAPVITSIDPPDVAYDGLTVVTINGENFSPLMTENQVTFNGRVAQIDVTASTSTKLVVTMPVVISDASINSLSGIQLMVAVQGAYAGAVYDHSFVIERAVVEFGGFVGEQPHKTPLAVASDSDLNTYVAGGDATLYKIDALGERSVFATGLSTVTTDLKVGPGGYLYFGRNTPFLYRVDPAGGVAASWLRVGKKANIFDFNADQNIYCGGKNDSLYFVDVLAGTALGVGLAKDYTYISLRVYDGYVYVAGSYSGTDASVTVTQALWKHEILVNNDLGERELVYDWASSEFASEQNITSVIVSDEGLFYLGLSAGSGPAIVTLNAATQTLEPFYTAVLSGPATHLSWSDDGYIFVARYVATPTEEVPNGVFRIAQSANSAPYYGRN